MHKAHVVSGRVTLYWIPLGAGGHFVRWNGRIYEALSAWRQRRPINDLYHSALEVEVDADRFVIESAPAWGASVRERGVVTQGAVGMNWLGQSRFFRYEIRCWRGGVIPDIDDAIGGGNVVSKDAGLARTVVRLVPRVPNYVWGRDVLGVGDMWNSNSIVSWLLAMSGHDLGSITPPPNGRAPGWQAGVAAAWAGSLVS